MSNNIVSINANKPQIKGPARCHSCRHTWEAVGLCGDEANVGGLECPGCGLNKGEFTHVAMPEDSTQIFLCGCGYDLFFVTLNGVFCPGCGDRHDAGDLWTD